MGGFQRYKGLVTICAAGFLVLVAGVAVRVVQLTPPPQSSRVSAIETRVDPLTDTESYYLFIDDSKPERYKIQSQTIIVGCNQEGLNVIFRNSSYHDLIDDSQEVSLSWDDSDIVNQTWDLNEFNSSQLKSRNPRAMVKDLISADKLEFGWSSHESALTSTTFQLTSFRDDLRMMLQLC